MALGHVRGSPPPETFFVPTDRDQGGRFSDDQPWGSRGGLAFRYYFPVDGEYLFEIAVEGRAEPTAASWGSPPRRISSM